MKKSFQEKGAAATLRPDVKGEMPGMRGRGDGVREVRKGHRAWSLESTGVGGEQVGNQGLTYKINVYICTKTLTTKGSVKSLPPSLSRSSPT